MSQIPFSIIIPTRQRHDTLKYTIQSVIEQSYPHFELIVMDNFSTPETAEVVASFNDSRIKYYRAPERLSMSDNWELGLSYATGEYILIIGDDDALMPDGLEIAAQWINDYDLSIISWNRFFYWWPSCIIPWRRNRYRINLNRNVAYVNSREKLQQYCKYQITFDELPMIYNSFIHHQLIQKIKAIHGKYFMSYSPDVYSGIVNAYYTEGYLYTYRALSIAGVSGHSTGASFTYGSLNSSACQAFIEDEKKDITAEQHPSLIPSKNHYINLADVFLRTKELFFPNDSQININIKELLDKMAFRINIDPGIYDTTLTEIQLLAQKYKIPISSLKIPAKQTKDPEAPQGFFLHNDGSGSLVINCQQAGISNVVQAVKLAQGILPPKEQFNFQTNFPRRTATTQKTSPLSPQFLNQLYGCVTLYQIDPSDTKILAELQNLRQEIANYWLNIPSEKLENIYSGEAGKAHQNLFKSGIKNEQLTESEKTFANQLITQLGAYLTHPKAINYLLAASLYLPKDKLTAFSDISAIPQWFLNDYQKLQ